MDAIAVFGLGSLKALLMLLIAAGVALALRRRPARLRAVVWGTALVGSLLIPLAAALLILQGLSQALASLGTLTGVERDDE